MAATFGVEPSFVLTATWHEGTRADASLAVVAPVFTGDYTDAFDRGLAFLSSPETGPAPPHALAISALEEAHFDGAVIRDVWVTAEMWAEPAVAAVGVPR